jgi:hypothetical protein
MEIVILETFDAKESVIITDTIALMENVRADIY